MERYDDYTVNQIAAKIDYYSKSVDHRKYDSFICAFLSHGEQDFIYAKDGKVKLQNVFAKFRGDQCQSLAGKPKIFFIQVLL